jgi:hypothetical protein
MRSFTDNFGLRGLMIQKHIFGVIYSFENNEGDVATNNINVLIETGVSVFNICLFVPKAVAKCLSL